MFYFVASENHLYSPSLASVYFLVHLFFFSFFASKAETGLWIARLNVWKWYICIRA